MSSLLYKTFLSRRQNIDRIDRRLPYLQPACSMQIVPFRNINAFFLQNMQAPIPIKSWKGIRNAEIYGTRCPAIENLNELQQNAANNKDLEDCLNMAVFSTDVI